MKSMFKIAALSLMLTLIAAPTFASSNGQRNSNNNRNTCERPHTRPNSNTCPCSDDENECCPKTEVKNENEANVHNNINSSSNTGNNRIIVRERHSFWQSQDPEVVSGDAYADGYAQVEGNNNTTQIDAAIGEVKVENENNAGIHNEISAVANSGENEIRVKGSHAETSIRTGNADSYASAVTMINSNVTRITHSEE